jgi:predicted lipoprotein with Yx(FWY)xxD motif
VEDEHQPKEEEMNKVLMALFGVLLLSAVTAAAADRPEVNTATKEGIGTYLTDSEGKTFYWFTKDTPGKSACSGPCLVKWPLFFCETITTSPDLAAGDFATIKREDGSQQTTFRGFPLYYWAGDAAPGDAKGQGVNGVWFVIDPRNFPPK